FKHTNEIEENSETLESESLLVQATLANLSGDAIIATKMAKSSFENLEGDENTNDLIALAKLLIQLELYPETMKVAERGLVQDPNNLELLSIHSKSLLASGDLPNAVETAQLTVALGPKSLDNRRHLGKTLATNEDWEQAIPEFQSLINNSEDFVIEDHKSLAHSALMAGDPNKAIETSELILENDISNGSAHSIIGESYLNLGQIKPAMDNLEKAISLSPEIPDPWLAISKYYLDKGDSKTAIEKLIAGNQAISENANLRFALGRSFLQQDQPTKALTEIQHAASLISDENPILAQEIYLSLGKTLIDLGYQDEAKKRLEVVNEKYPDNILIAHLFAKSLISSDEIPEAIEILGKAIQSPEANLEIFTDYGEAHLKLGEDPKEAIRAFEKVLTADPENAKSLAQLAEAISLDGDSSKSLAIYKQALEKGLGSDPEWNLRIKIGMAKSALESKKPEVAVAALEDLIENNPDDIRVMKILTDAYLASNLKDSSLKTLKSIHKLSKNLPTTLMWVADKALVLDQAEIATEALTSAAKIAPEKSNILVKLGYQHLQNENIDLAKETFSKILEITSPDTKDLRLTAKALYGLEDLSESVPFLEKAIELESEDQSEILSELTRTYIQLEDFEKSLEVIERHISLSATEPNLLKTRSEILMKLGRPMAALSSIHDAIKLEPTNSNLHLEASKLFRANQDLSAAIHHSEKAYELSPDDEDIRFHAAQIKFATLDRPGLKTLLFETDNKKVGESWRMMQIQYLIQDEEFSKAIELFEQIEFLSPEHPQYLAVKAQILHHQGNDLDARSSLQKAIDIVDNEPSTSIEDAYSNSYFSIVEAAISLWEWEIALELSNKLFDKLPSEPIVSWIYMKALSLRAEFQHLCEAASVIKHSPGPIATNEQSSSTFEEIAESAVRTACTEFGGKEALRWQARGRLAFGNIEADLEALSNSPGDVAAQVAALRHSNEIDQALKIAQTQKDDPSILIQVAIALSEDEKLMESQGAAYKAAEKQANNPFNHAILAILAEESEEYSLALESIRRSLNIWGDEPDWHILAGILQSRLGYRTATIAHFEKATQLRPNYAPYILELGKAHLSDQRSESAVKVLENAIQLNPENSEIWSCLATAYQQSGDFDQASYCVEKLIELNPDQVSPYLVGAQINLSAENIDNAEEMISKALEIEPDLTEALQLQAQTFSLGNQPEKAISILDKAISKTIEPLPLLIERAKLIPLLHGEKEGLSTLKSIAQEYPEEPTILMALTDAFIQAGKYEDAIKAAQYALKVNFGKLSQKDIAQLQYQLGVLLRQSGQYDLSIHYLNETIQLSPGFLNAYLEIAEVYHQRRQHQEALDYLQQAISISPNDPRPFAIAGNLLREAKDYQGAKEMLDRAAEIAPKDIDIQRKLGAVTALTLVHPTQGKED
ncbi:MAG: tetratricopeptide repeat protein, partial [Chloroflexi bacterium]|nr:tetratricopeptide repeat protein [Chloroflexota bacterium]